MAHIDKVIDAETILMLKVSKLSDNLLTSVWVSMDYEPREMYDQYVSFERYEQIVYAELMNRGIVG